MGLSTDNFAETKQNLMKMLKDELPAKDKWDKAG